MRSAFLAQLLELAERDRRIVLVTGDLGFSVFEPFAERLPDQFVNAGVAEQNMTALAAGMALTGKIVFTYSIANFPTLRCLEQVRHDVCYHHADVKVVSVGGGFAYGASGATHHATEDLAVMRALPGMVVLAPGDPVETRAAVRAIVERPGPAYLRLGKAGEPTVHPGPIEFSIGRALRLRVGTDLTLISTGGMLQTASAAAGHLAERGISTEVLSMPTLEPLDVDAVLDAARRTGVIATLEEHGIIGGLGSAVAETLAESAGHRARFVRLGAPKAFAERVGSQGYMLRELGLDERAVAARLEAHLRGARAPGA